MISLQTLQGKVILKLEFQISTLIVIFPPQTILQENKAFLPPPPHFLYSHCTKPRNYPREKTFHCKV